METLIIAHGDTDGVTSASIAKAVYPEGEVFFSHPVGLYGDLKPFKDARRVIILDIALSEHVLKEVIELLEELACQAEVVYIDHHPPPLDLRVLEEKGVRVVHDENACAAELAFRFYADKLSSDMSRVALYGAIGDYAINTPFVQETLKLWDIRSLYFEAGVLIQGLEYFRKDYDIKRRVVGHLSLNRLPSDLPELLVASIIEARREEELRRKLPELIKTYGEIAYVINPPGSLGRSAFYARVYAKKKVGIAMEERKNLFIMSLRATEESMDLNSILREITPKLGGSGGGHRLAAGARIPKERLNEFLELLSSSIT